MLPPHRKTAMIYHVTFRQRFNQQGIALASPNPLLNLPDGVVERAELLQDTEPDSVHVEEDMEEDDDLLPFGNEIWEYQVCDDRADEFVNALKESGIVLDYETIEQEE